MPRILLNLLLALLVAVPALMRGMRADGSADTPPDVVVLDDLEDLYEPVLFDHRRHADMTGMTVGCAACHHRSPEGAAHPACRTCHEASGTQDALRRPGLRGAYHRQCMGCHRDWAHETACNACHLPRARAREGAGVDVGPSTGDLVRGAHPPIVAQTTYVYPTSMPDGPFVTFHHVAHAEAYGPACVDCHRGESCGRCHGNGAVLPRRLAIDHRQSCLPCHGGRDCAFCHDRAERPRFDHETAAAWPLEPYHAEVRCAACHRGQASFTPPGRECHACHGRGRLEGFDHGPVSSRDDDIGCLSCHDEMARDLDCAAVVHGPAAAGACTSCHEPADPASSSLARESRRALCLGCHDRCLDAGEGRSIPNIAALLADCPVQHGPFRAGDCAACHRPHESAHAALLVSAFPAGPYAPFSPGRYRLCFSCHAEEAVMAVSGAGVTGFRDGDRNLHRVHVNQAKGRTCRMCHDAHASSRPFRIRESVPFGAWTIEIDYARTADGGACSPACHGPQTYHRGARIVRADAVREDAPH